MVVLLVVCCVLPIVAEVASLIVTVIVLLSIVGSADVSSRVYILNVIRLGRFVLSKYC